jgi:hypothetical protein
VLRLPLRPDEDDEVIWKLCRLVLSTILLPLSCGGGDAATAEAFVAAYCDLLAPCCAMANLPSDGAQCRTLTGAFAGSASYDRSKGEACLGEMRAASAHPTFCSEGLQTSSDACDRVFDEGGTRKPGETCSDDSDCAPSTEGKVDCRASFGTGSEVRKCQLQIRGKAGDTPCLGTVDGNATTYAGGSTSDIPARGYLCYVADGVRCDTSTGGCVAFKAIGEACGGSSTDCVNSAYCDVAQRLCVARKAIGSACTSSQQCVAGSTCDTTRTCVGQLADGAACTQSARCASGRCVNGTCSASSSGNLGLAFICGSR